MPIKRGEIHLFISFCGEKFSPKMLDKKDRRRVKKYPNLIKQNSFKISRYLKFKAKLRGKICLSHSLNFTDSLNESLTQAKELALKLKIAALVVAFLLLWFYFSAAISVLVMGIIIFRVLLTLFIFAIFGVNLSIFGVFGLILASAVGIDYMIFALNESLSEKERIYGIFCAFITSFISFFTLSFSQTAALSVFGLSVSLCVLIYGLCASVLSCLGLCFFIL
ncbi:hypothetical protein [Campylobacter concisus]